MKGEQLAGEESIIAVANMTTPNPAVSRGLCPAPFFQDTLFGNGGCA